MACGKRGQWQWRQQQQHVANVYLALHAIICPAHVHYISDTGSRHLRRAALRNKLYMCLQSTLLMLSELKQPPPGQLSWEFLRVCHHSGESRGHHVRSTKLQTYVYMPQVTEGRENCLFAGVSRHIFNCLTNLLQSACNLTSHLANTFNFEVHLVQHSAHLLHNLATGCAH